jgi:hypothetical protein
LRLADPRLGRSVPACLCSRSAFFDNAIGGHADRGRVAADYHRSRSRSPLVEPRLRPENNK